jgi:hypothetical protein
LKWTISRRGEVIGAVRLQSDRSRPKDMSDDKTASEPIALRSTALGAILVFGFLAFSCGGCWMLIDRSERLATFTVGPYTINVFAEPEFHYEPPGYIYFELQQWGQTRIPQRRFTGIGSERKPAHEFTLIKTADEQIVALVLRNDIQMIHEFSSGFTWPGPYTNVTEPQWQTAELLLQRIRVDNPGVSCSRQLGYRGELDRRHRKDGEQSHALEPAAAPISNGRSSPAAQ